MSQSFEFNLVFRILITWLLFSIGLWKISGKMNWKQRWMAWVPALRYYALGKSMEMAREGALCGALELLSYITYLINPNQLNERAAMAVTLLSLVVLVMMIVYNIRLFLRLCVVFGIRKTWVILWIVCDWLALLILGFGKRYQPKVIRFEEEWEAGTAPTDIKDAAISGHKPLESGLSLVLRERTVSDFGKTRYLLKEITLDIPNGSLVLLLGGSGAGKTTLVNAIIGYEKADATVTLNGSDIYKEYDQMKYRIGFVPQKNLIRGNDTVMHTVSDAAQMRLPKASKRQKRGRSWISSA